MTSRVLMLAALALFLAPAVTAQTSVVDTTTVIAITEELEAWRDQGEARVYGGHVSYCYSAAGNAALGPTRLRLWTSEAPAGVAVAVSPSSLSITPTTMGGKPSDCTRENVTVSVRVGRGVTFEDTGTAVIEAKAEPNLPLAGSHGNTTLVLGAPTLRHTPQTSPSQAPASGAAISERDDPTPFLFGLIALSGAVLAWRQYKSGR